VTGQSPGSYGLGTKSFRTWWAYANCRPATVTYLWDVVNLALKMRFKYGNGRWEEGRGCSSGPCWPIYRLYRCVCQREAKRRRTIVQLEHDVKRRLQDVSINSFRRRHAFRAGTCRHHDDVIADTDSSDSHRCSPQPVPAQDACHSLTRL